MYCYCHIISNGLMQPAIQKFVIVVGGDGGGSGDGFCFFVLIRAGQGVPA